MYNYVRDIHVSFVSTILPMNFGTVPTVWYFFVSANLKLGDTGHSSIKEGGSMSEVAGSSNSYKPITNTAWVRARLCKLQKRWTRLAAASDKVYQLLAHGRWFSPVVTLLFIMTALYLIFKCYPF
jgi:hypothetical protein